MTSFWCRLKPRGGACFGRNWAKSRSVGAVMVKFDSEPELEDGIDKIRSLLRQRHRLAEDQDDDFSVRNMTEVMNTVGAAAGTLSLLLAAVARCHCSLAASGS